MRRSRVPCRILGLLYATIDSCWHTGVILSLIAKDVLLLSIFLFFVSPTQFGMILSQYV